jgi:tetratricopeptide (TPR) repeat protein
MLSPKDKALAKILVKRKLLTSEQVSEGIKELKALAKRGKSLPLGQILIKKRYLDVHQFIQLYSEITDSLHSCPGCGRHYVVELGEVEKRITCNKCGHTIAIPAAVSEKEGEPEEKEEKQPLVFGPYEILEEVARGGMGVIFKARQKEPSRIVALKVLKGGSSAAPEQIRRFRREAESVAQLRHVNIVRLYEVGVIQGLHYFTMDFIEGESLEDILNRRPPGLERSLEIVAEVAEAIAYAHRKGIIHRDLKPANILLDRHKRPKITDFGLAKDLESQTKLTLTGAIVGTPYYMSPEQARGEKEKVGPRSDVYSLGVILYQLLTGRLPFYAETAVELYHKINKEEPISPRRLNRRVSAVLETICLKAMDKDPEIRYAGAAELASDLRKYLAGEAVRARAPGMSVRFMRKAKGRKLFTATILLAFLLLLAGIPFLYSRIRAHQKRVGRTAALQELAGFRRSLENLEMRCNAALSRSALELKEGRPEEAIAWCNKSLRLLSGASGLPTRLKHRENAEKAKEILVRFLSGSFRRLKAEACLQRARALMARGVPGNLPLALRDFDEAISLGNESFRAFCWKAEALRGAGRLQEAMAAYNRALGLPAERRKPDAELIRAYIGRGRIRIATGDTQGALRDAEEVLRREPKDLGGLALRGEALLEMKRFDDAEGDFARILSMDGQNLTALLGRARVDAALGRSIEAEKGFGRTVSLHPEDPEVYLLRGQFYLGRRLVPEALDDFTRAVDKGPGLWKARMFMGVTREHLLDAAEAEASLQAAVDLARKAGKRPLGMALHALGQFLARSGKIPKARRLLTEALTAHPDFVPALLTRGLLLAKSAPYMALKDLTRAYSLEPRNPEIRKALGKIFLLRGERLKAREHLTAVLAKCPGDGEAYALRAKTYELHGDRTLSDADYQAALTREPGGNETAAYHYRKGREWVAFAVQTKKFKFLDKAIPHLERVVRLNPRFSNAWVELGLAYLRKNKVKKALTFFHEAIKANPFNPRSYLNRGRIRLQVKGFLDYRKALKDFDRAIELGENSVDVFNLRGVSLARLDRHKKAVEDFTRMLEISPDIPLAYSNRSLCYRRLGMTRLADEDMKRYQELTKERSKRALDHFKKGMEHQNKGERANAITEYRRALKLMPNYGSALHRLSGLYFDTGRVFDSNLTYAKLVRVKPDLEPEYYQFLFQLRKIIDHRRFHETIADFLKKHPRSIEGRLYRGSYYFGKATFGDLTLEEFYSGIGDFSVALQEDPAFLVAYLYRGQLYQHKRRFKRALADYEKALEINVRHPTTHLFLATLYAAGRDEKLALKELRLALKFGFSDLDRIKNHPDLEALSENPEFRKILEKKPKKN